MKLRLAEFAVIDLKLSDGCGLAALRQFDMISGRSSSKELPPIVIHSGPLTSPPSGDDVRSSTLRSGQGQVSIRNRVSGERDRVSGQLENCGCLPLRQACQQHDFPAGEF